VEHVAAEGGMNSAQAVEAREPVSSRKKRRAYAPGKVMAGKRRRPTEKERLREIERNVSERQEKRRRQSAG
jgi:hypothetical protein